MALAKPVYLNGWSTTLSGSVASSATTTFSLTAAPPVTLATDEFIPCVVVDTSTTPETIKEFVYLTVAATSSTGVVRAAEDASTYPAAALASGLTVAAIHTVFSDGLRDDLRARYGKPNSLLIETYSRYGATASTSFTPSSGQLYLFGIKLPKGLIVSNIAFLSSGASATPTHWWFGLYDNAGVQLAVTADQTTTVWAASTLQSLAIATTAGGSASSFVTTYAGLHYIGVMQAASTRATVVCVNSSATLNALTPAANWTSDTSQTAPPSFPHTATNGGSVGSQVYGGVS